MDPFSFGVGALTLVGIILKLSSAAVEALSYAKNLESRYQRVTQSLQNAVGILHRLRGMTEAIDRIDDGELRSQNVTTQTFRQLLISVETLSDALQTHRSTAHKKSRFLRDAFRASFKGHRKDDGLQQAWEHFNNNLNCLNVLLHILQV
jgi:hypothetical protein